MVMGCVYKPRMLPFVLFEDANVACIYIVTMFSENYAYHVYKELFAVHRPFIVMCFAQSIWFALVRNVISYSVLLLLLKILY